MRLYAETKRDFFLKELDAQITFQTEGRRPATDKNCRCPGVCDKKGGG